MWCRTCNEEMIPFGIYLEHDEKDGHICPVCGLWIYDRKKIDRSECGAAWLAMRDRKKRFVSKDLRAQ